MAITPTSSRNVGFSSVTALSSAQILALHTTAVTLVAAVAGSVIVPRLILTQLIGAAYTEAGQTRFSIDTWASADWGFQVGSLFSTANVIRATNFLAAVSSLPATSATTSNKPLLIGASAALTASAATAVVTVIYDLVAVA